MNRTFLSRRASIFAAGLLFATLLSACGTTASTVISNPASFYRGKTITWIVPVAAGTTPDIWARVVAHSLGTKLHATINVKDISGASGRIAYNDLYSAKPNGLTIGEIESSAFLGQLAHRPGVHYNLGKLTWLGGGINTPGVLQVPRSLPINSITQLMSYHSILKWGANGKASNSYAQAVVLKDALGLKLDIVTDYPNGHQARLGLVEGQVQIGSSSLSGYLTEKKVLRAILLFSRQSFASAPGVPNVTILKSRLSPQKYALILDLVNFQSASRFVAAPPGISKSQATFLADALHSALTSSTTIAALTKVKQASGAVSAQTVHTIATELVESSKEFRSIVTGS